MTEQGRCVMCRWWTRQRGGGAAPVVAATGLCALFTWRYGVPRPDHLGGIVPQAWPFVIADMPDADVDVDFMTAPDFGCVQWEARGAE
jgi:hypothetical protein